jgi:hypothetical protein
MAPVSSGNLRQRVGYFGSENGIFLELSDQVYMVRRSNVTGTITDTHIAQSAWSNDQLNGYGTSGFTLDLTTTQIFWTDIEWLGVGNVRTGFVLNGQFVVAHVFQHANYSKAAYMTTANLPVRYEIQTLSGSAPVTSNLTQICSTVISEGGYEEPFRLFSNISAVTRTLTANTWSPVMSLRLRSDRLDAVAQVKQVDIVVTTSDVIHWALWSNVTTSDLTGESFVNEPYSTMVQIDKSATALTTTTCRQIANGLVSGTNQAAVPITLELSRYYSQIGRDSFSQTSEIVTLAVFSVAGIGGGGVTFQALLSWNELL